MTYGPEIDICQFFHGFYRIVTGRITPEPSAEHLGIYLRHRPLISLRKTLDTAGTVCTHDQALVILSFGNLCPGSI